MSRKLVIHDIDHFRKAMKFSNKCIPDGNRNLKRELKYLLNSCYAGEELHLGKDFVEHSFSFSFQTPDHKAPNGYRQGLWGGLILHGLQESFSVELAGQPGLHYSIHT